jgi:ATP-binding cassette subfamily C protein LapB
MLEYTQIKQFLKRDSEFSVLLLPLLQALHWDQELRVLAENLPYGTETISLLDLRNILDRLGYKSEEIAISANNVHHDLFPILYVPEDEPACIITKYQDNVFLGITNESGVEHEINIDFMHGVAYFFIKQKENAMTQVHKTTWFYEYLLQYRWIIGQALLISMLINILLLVVPLYIMNLYNRVVPSGSMSLLFSFLFAGVLILIFGTLLEKARTNILAYVGSKVDRAINLTLINTFLYLPISYIEGVSLGKQLSRLRNFEAVRDFFVSPLVSLTFEVPFVVVFIFATWLLGGMLVIVPIAMILVFALVYYISLIYAERASTTYSQFNTEKQAIQLEILTNMQDIKSMGEERLWLHKYRDNLSRAVQAGYRASVLSANMGIVSETLMNFAAFVMVSWGTFYAIDGEISLGGLVASMMLIWKILQPMKTFFSVLPKLYQFIMSLKQVNTIAIVKTEKDIEKNITLLGQNNNKIVFSKVGFKYRSELAPALIGVSFSVNSNELVCLSGSSGSGKTTIFNLILGLYQPQAGNIFLNDINLNQIDLFELRRYLAMLPQEGDVFHGSILENILCSYQIADKYAVEIAARMARVYEEIMKLPQGFNTVINCKNISKYAASFKKRLCLARVFLKKSSIWLFDEPESLLDTQGVYELEELLKYYKGKKTIILSTHRPELVQLADRVLYFHEGQLLYDTVPEDFFTKVPLEGL